MLKALSSTTSIVALHLHLASLAVSSFSCLKSIDYFICCNKGFNCVMDFFGAVKRLNLECYSLSSIGLQENKRADWEQFFLLLVFNSLIS